MPRLPWACSRRQWSSSGSRKPSVLPEPVPVATRVLRGEAELRRRKTFSWWR